MADSSSGKVEIKRHSWLVDFFIRLVREKPLGTIGAVIALLFLLIAIFANFLAPYGMDEVNTVDRLLAPSADYWLGTDHLGRDLLSRVIFGARISATVGLAVAFFSSVIATFMGIVSGYLGGKFDLIVQRVVDALMCFPALLFFIAILSLTGPGLWAVILVLSLWWGITGSRVIRSATMSARENVYVQAAVAIGCSTPRILIRHILPNVMAAVVILATVRVAGAILIEASLSFLGFGVPPPAPSWVGMLSDEARKYMFAAPWIAIWPGLALSISVFGINMFGDAVRDLLDPRLRGSVGHYGVRVKKRSHSKK